MSDPKSKKSVPSWQLPRHDVTSSTPSTTSASEEERSTLIQQAAKFLQDDSIREAPTDRKIEFLESKGLTSKEIESLLGVSRSKDASSPSASTTEDDKRSKQSDPRSTDETKSVTISSESTSSPSSTKPSTASRDVPPIITYPEFLIEAAKPPPLITLRSVLYTLYGAAGLGASIYGASEFLVNPMLASLTSARHELALTATEDLKKLNEKLEHNVSRIPPHLTARAPTLPATAATVADDDSDSITSDPTELFHRDIATQTTPDLINDTDRPSSSSSPSSHLTGAVHGKDVTENEGSDVDPLRAVNNHIQRLTTIRSKVSNLVEIEKDAASSDEVTYNALSQLHRDLDALAYGGGSSSTYTTSTLAGYGGFNSSPGVADGSFWNGGSSSGGGGGGGATAAGGGIGGLRKDEAAAINQFKQEIRGVKGVLLSARNFPSGTGGRIVGGVPVGGR